MWCEWTSTEATKQFEANLPRPRRLSAPSRAVTASRKIRQRPPRRKSADSTVSSAGPHTPQHERVFSSMCSSKGVPGITTVLETFYGDVCHDDRRVDPRNVEAVDHDTGALSVVSTNSHNVQKETVDGGGVHRVATATSITVRPRPRMANVLIYIILVLCSHRCRLLPFRTLHPNPRQNYTRTIPKIGI